MSTKHTPGPWRACASGQIVAGPMSRQVARVWNTKNREYDTVNAQLIAAAPDLLAALQLARKELHACQAVIHLAGGFDPAYVNDAQAALKVIDEAISRATGGEV